MPCTFITGPVRSGKSRFAERLARERGGEVVYVATARRDPDDAEWVARLAHHAARRPATWRVVETAEDGAPALEDLAAGAPAGTTLLVDSLGTWLANEMRLLFEAAGPGGPIDALGLENRAVALVDALAASRANAIVVGDETGWGVVPAYPAGRAFRDVLGRAQQRLAAGAQAAYLVVAGFAIDLRRQGEPIGPDM